MAEVGLRRGALLASVCALLSWLAPMGSARAESSLRLPYPESFGEIPAATYNIEHERVGDATLRIETVDPDLVRLRVESGIDGGAHTVATAELTAADDGHTLRLLRQESRSVDPDGVNLGVLSIDHESGIASCTKGSGDGAEREELTLPEGDRVANVPLNLLFQPLVKGTADQVSFQVLLCRFGARLVDIDAHVVPHEADDAANPYVEVEYQPNFGRAVSLFAQRWLPHLSIWFDPRVRNPWVAHRVPLYSKGPEVFVVRDEALGSWLGSLR